VAAEDPSVSGVSGRYATALFELARDEKSIDAVRADLDKFEAMLTERGEATADVTVAETLSDRNLDALKTALKSVTGKDVTLNVKVDPSIIGGLVVKLGSRMVDSSLRTKLNSIKHAMKEAG
jgi:F-type H+-transporting ATPase subunit delta